MSSFFQHLSRLPLNYLPEEISNMNISTISPLVLPSLLPETIMVYPYEDMHIHPNNVTVSIDYSSTHRFLIRCLSFYALVLVIIGTLGNLVTIIVLCRRNLRRYVTMRYLIAVSVCDIISLYGWNLNNFYKFTISANDYNLEEKSLIHCRIMSYLTFVGLQLSSWCLTAVSLDRCLSIYLLTWKHKYGKLSHTKYYIAILAIACLLLNSHILIFNGYRTDPPENAIRCYRTRSNPFYIFPQWECVHLVVYNLCPFIIMLSCNTYIIYITIRSARVRTSRRQTDASGKLSSSSTSRHRQLSLMLMLVTFAFVLLTLPSCIYFVFFRHRMPTTKDSRSFRHLVQICLGSVQFTSHAINFFLYCFSATNFRDELHDFIREIFCRQPADFKSRRSLTTSIRITTPKKDKSTRKKFNSNLTLVRQHIEHNHHCEDVETELINHRLKDGLNADYRSTSN